MKIRDRIKELRRVKAKELVPNPRNWRTHPKAQQDALKGLLAEIGYADALLARELPDGSLVLVDGHLRAETTPNDKVPVLILDVTEEEANKLLLTLDPLAAMAEASTEALGKLLLENSSQNAAVQKMLDELGASHGIACFETGNGEQAPDPEPQIDRAAELQAKWGTAAGQLWTIPGKAGVHRVLCGDSTKAEDVGRLMGGDCAEAVVSDPPYGIGFGYESHDDNRRGWFALMNKVVPMIRSMARFVVIPSCGIDRMGWWYANHKPDWIIAWYKGSPGHCSHVGFNDWEALLVWGKPVKPMHDYFQTECGFKDEPGHPCPKPIAWAAWLVERAATEGGLVYDPFLGSGTTLIAAENLSRICYGMEISPAYVAVILQRAADAGLSPVLSDANSRPSRR